MSNGDIVEVKNRRGTGNIVYFLERDIITIKQFPRDADTYRITEVVLHNFCGGNTYSLFIWSLPPNGCEGLHKIDIMPDDSTPFGFILFVSKCQ